MKVYIACLRELVFSDDYEELEKKEIRKISVIKKGEKTSTKCEDEEDNESFIGRVNIKHYIIMDSNGKEEKDIIEEMEKNVNIYGMLVFEDNKFLKKMKNAEGKKREHLFLYLGFYDKKLFKNLEIDDDSHYSQIYYNEGPDDYEDRYTFLTKGWEDEQEEEAIQALEEDEDVYGMIKIDLFLDKFVKKYKNKNYKN